MDKLGTAFACLLLGTALLPSGFAHWDSNGSPLDPNDLSKLDSPNNPGTGQDRVSGWYLGSAGALLVVNNAPDASDNCDIPTTTAYFTVLDGLIRVVGEDPRQTCWNLLSGGNKAYYVHAALCDLEVSFPGGLDNDEAFVDGSNAGPGLVEDHWNDGGIGAVCHTPEGNYDSIENGFDYDTGGCGYAPAYGEDAVLEVLWGSPSCDDTTPGSTGGLVNHVQTLGLCAVNSVLAANIPGDIAGFVAAEAECVDNFVECANEVLKDPPLGAGSLETVTDSALNGLSGGPDDNAANTGPVGSDCPSGASACGADGVHDVANFGDLSAKNGFFFGVPFPGHYGCNEFGAAAVFVWNAVVISTGPLTVTPGVATFGWIE